MSQSIRFLGLAIFAWVGVRALSLGVVPGTKAFAFDAPPQPGEPAASASIPPIEPTQFPALPQIAPAGYATPPGPAGAYPPQFASVVPVNYGGYPIPRPYPVAVPYPVFTPAYGGPPARQSMPIPRRQDWEAETMASSPDYPQTPELDEYPMSRMAAAGGGSRPALQSTPSFSDQPNKRGYDRWELSSWAMMRSRPGPASLATGGTLGGSQAGSRILFRFDPRLAVSVRTSTPLQTTRRGIETALGLRVQPFRSIPVAITAERRQWFGKSKGRSDFALFAEGGLYGTKLPFDAKMEAYLQTGIVGVKQRDWFVDGAIAATRPVWRNLSAGVGVWGGAQPGLTRLDAGPRLTLGMGKGMRIHADYRAKLLGNAQPGSGTVVTLAGDF